MSMTIIFIEKTNCNLLLKFKALAFNLVKYLFLLISIFVLKLFLFGDIRFIVCYGSMTHFASETQV